MDVVNRENESVPRHYNIADLFEMTAAEVPERTAIVGGDTRLTYRELDERSNRFAHHLIGCGLGKDARVAIYSWNRTEWVDAMMGAFKARMTPINVNYRYVADELRYILENSGSEALVFERSFAPIVEKVRSDLPGLTHYIVLEDGSDEPFEGGISFEDALAASSPDAAAHRARRGRRLHPVHRWNDGLPQGGGLACTRTCSSPRWAAAGTASPTS